MAASDTELLERYRAVAVVVAALPADAAVYAGVRETVLLEVNQLFATSQVALRGGGAFIAGEIAHRSAPELGSRGLAQRSGHRTAEQFVKVTTGATGRDAVTAVRVGSLMREAAVEGQVDILTGVVVTRSEPWLSPVTEALGSRSISIEAADAIRAGLGAPHSAISETQLANANPDFLLCTGAPVIRLTTTRIAFERGVGIARIEGQVAPVSISTVSRLSCEAGTAGIIFNPDGTVLDFGREQRFFTRKRKHALAVLWGGCAAPGCDRPTSWTAHHIVFWKRDNGTTNLADGMPF